MNNLSNLSILKNIAPNNLYGYRNIARSNGFGGT